MRRAVERLRATDIVLRNRFPIADDRIHDRVHVLAILVWMREPQSVPHLVDQDATDVSNRITVGSKSQKPAVRIETLMIIEQNVGLAHPSAVITIVSDGQSAGAELLAEDRARERDRIYAIARAYRRTCINDGAEVQTLHVRIPGVWRRHGCGVP